MTGPENAVSQVETRNSDAAPGIWGPVCVVVGNEDGNRSLFLAFLKNKRLSKTCGRGKFDGCEGQIRPFLDDTLECVSESIMLQKRARLVQAAN